jgi:hypothetical protein
MRGKTKIQQDGTPRTKGIRNACVMYAMACKGGPMKNPRDKRQAQKERRYEEAAG